MNVQQMADAEAIEDVEAKAREAELASPSSAIDQSA